jgi:hypothetical protein
VPGYLSRKINGDDKFLFDILYIDFRMLFSQNVVVILTGKHREMSVLQGGL